MLRAARDARLGRDCCEEPMSKRHRTRKTRPSAKRSKFVRHWRTVAAALLIASIPLLSALLTNLACALRILDPENGIFFVVAAIALGDAIAYAVIAVSDAKNVWPHSFLAGSNGFLAVALILMLSGGHPAAHRPALADRSVSETAVSALEAERIQGVGHLFKVAPIREAARKYRRAQPAERAPNHPRTIAGDFAAILDRGRATTLVTRRRRKQRSGARSNATSPRNCALYCHNRPLSLVRTRDGGKP